MPNNCCICKSHSGTHEDITFHIIPNDTELREKWIEVIGKDVSKWSYVCSDHFDIKNDFKYSTKSGVVRRYLIKGSIPKRESNFLQSRLLMDDGCTVVNTPLLLKSKNDPKSDIGLQGFKKKCPDCSIRAESSAIFQTKSNKRNDNNDTLCRQMSSEDECMNNKNVHSQSLRGQENSVNVPIGHTVSRSPSQDRNVRFHAVVSAVKTDQLKIRPRRVQFIGDLLPIDFVKPENHRIVTLYRKKQAMQVNRLQKQVSRLKAKVKDLTSLLADLHAQGLISSNVADDSINQFFQLWQV